MFHSVACRCKVCNVRVIESRSAQTMETCVTSDKAKDNRVTWKSQTTGICPDTAWLCFSSLDCMFTYTSRQREIFSLITAPFQSIWGWVWSRGCAVILPAWKSRRREPCGCWRNSPYCWNLCWCASEQSDPWCGPAAAWHCLPTSAIDSGWSYHNTTGHPRCLLSRKTIKTIVYTCVNKSRRHHRIMSTRWNGNGLDM